MRERQPYESTRLRQLADVNRRRHQRPRRLPVRARPENTFQPSGRRIIEAMQESKRRQDRREARAAKWIAAANVIAKVLRTIGIVLAVFGYVVYRLLRMGGRR